MKTASTVISLFARTRWFLLAGVVLSAALVLGLAPRVLPSLSAASPLECFAATLTGDAEVPAHAVGGFGSGLVVLTDPQTMVVNESFFGLTGPATASHIHGPSLSNQTAAILFPFNGVPAATAGSIPTQTFAISASDRFFLESGQYYMNVHTNLFPGGEIRGTLLPTPCAQSQPLTPGAAASSQGGVVLSPGAAVSTQGGVVLSPGAAVSTQGGVVLLPGAAVSTQGGVVSSPSGTVPSQVAALARPLECFTATLTGDAEVPAHAVGGFGSGLVVLTDPQTMVVNESFFGLTGPATASHIHGPSLSNQTAAILFPFNGVPAATAGSIPTQTFAISVSDRFFLENGQYYMNVHTPLFPGGEIRGTLLPAPCA